MMRSINPATEETIAEYTPLTDHELDEALGRSERAYQSWRHTSFEQRAEMMHRAADVLREERDRFAALMTAEMGKTIEEARSEVTKCAWACDYYADHAEEFLTPRQIATDASLSMVRYDPLGPILAVMPWNFPFWQVFRFAAPYLMAGDVGLLKHAANTQGSALAIAEVFQEAGFPEGVFQTLVITSDHVEGVIGDDRVRGVTLTGSEGAGRAVGAQAGRALKPCVLELGGSDPFIVLDDADIGQAAHGACRGRLINNGQSCIAAKRFIVHARVHDQFVEALRAEMASKVMGDPMDEGVDVGPQARDDLREALHDQVTRSIAEGARCVLGGELPEGKGFYYPPTLLVEVGSEVRGVSRGDVRPSGRRDPRHIHRTGHRAGEHIELRTRRQPVDRRCGSGVGLDSAHRVRSCRRQRDRQERPAPSLWRDQELGLWA